MPRDQNALVREIVRALAKEYGVRALEVAVSELRPSSSRSRVDQSPLSSDAGPLKEIPKVTAVGMVARSGIPPARKEPLGVLAEKFDSKQFLPSTADAREFLILFGGRPKVMKNRPDAFRQVLALLSKMPAEKLRELAESAAHSGPSQLSFLSDAISAAGAARREQREPST